MTAVAVSRAAEVDVENHFVWIPQFKRLTKEVLLNLTKDNLFRLLKKLEGHVSGDVAKLRTKPKRATKFCSAFRRLLGSVKLIAGQLDRQEELEAYPSLGLCLNNFINILLNSTMKDRKPTDQIAHDIYSFVKLILDGSPEYVLDTILQSNAADDSAEDDSTGRYLFEMIVRDKHFYSEDEETFLKYLTVASLFQECEDGERIVKSVFRKSPSYPLGLRDHLIKNNICDTYPAPEPIDLEKVTKKIKSRKVIGMCRKRLFVVSTKSKSSEEEGEGIHSDETLSMDDASLPTFYFDLGENYEDNEVSSTIPSNLSFAMVSTDVMDAMQESGDRLTSEETDSEIENFERAAQNNEDSLASGNTECSNSEYDQTTFQNMFARRSSSQESNSPHHEKEDIEEILISDAVGDRGDVSDGKESETVGDTDDEDAQEREELESLNSLNDEHELAVEDDSELPTEENKEEEEDDECLIIEENIVKKTLPVAESSFFHDSNDGSGHDFVEGRLPISDDIENERDEAEAESGEDYVPSYTSEDEPSEPEEDDVKDKDYPLQSDVVANEGELENIVYHPEPGVDEEQDNVLADDECDEEEDDDGLSCATLPSTRKVDSPIAKESVDTEDISDKESVKEDDLYSIVEDQIDAVEDSEKEVNISPQKGRKRHSGSEISNTEMSPKRSVKDNAPKLEIVDKDSESEDELQIILNAQDDTVQDSGKQNNRSGLKGSKRTSVSKVNQTKRTSRKSLKDNATILDISGEGSEPENESHKISNEQHDAVKQTGREAKVKPQKGKKIISAPKISRVSRSSKNSLKTNAPSFEISDEHSEAAYVSVNISNKERDDIKNFEKETKVSPVKGMKQTSPAKLNQAQRTSRKGLRGSTLSLHPNDYGDDNADAQSGSPHETLKKQNDTNEDSEKETFVTPKRGSKRRSVRTGGSAKKNLKTNTPKRDISDEDEPGGESLDSSTEQHKTVKHSQIEAKVSPQKGRKRNSISKTKLASGSSKKNLKASVLSPDTDENSDADERQNTLTEQIKPIKEAKDSSQKGRKRINVANRAIGSSKKSQQANSSLPDIVDEGSEGDEEQNTLTEQFKAIKGSKKEAKDSIQKGRKRASVANRARVISKKSIQANSSLPDIRDEDSEAEDKPYKTLTEQLVSCENSEEEEEKVIVSPQKGRKGRPPSRVNQTSVSKNNQKGNSPNPEKVTAANSRKRERSLKADKLDTIDEITDQSGKIGRSGRARKSTLPTGNSSDKNTESSSVRKSARISQRPTGISKSNDQYYY